MRFILGIDPSLTATGVAVAEAGGPVRWIDTIRTPAPARIRRAAGWQHTRLDTIGRAVTDLVRPYDTLAVIEGPAYSRQQQAGHHESAGLWWLLAHQLWAAGVPYVVVPPSARARYAAGKGNAAKDSVLAAAIRRYGHLAEITNNNEADALILAAMAADWMGWPLAPVPARYREALSGVSWPDLVTGGGA